MTKITHSNLISLVSVALLAGCVFAGTAQASDASLFQISQLLRIQDQEKWDELQKVNPLARLVHDPRACVMNVTDPFEPRQFISQGKFSGRCVDTSEDRPVRRLKKWESAAFGPIEGHVLLANFRHAGKFWVAKVPANGVEEVIFQKNNIMGKLMPIAHTSLRFKMRKEAPIVLVPQEVGVGGTPDRSAEIRLSDFNYSVDPVPPQGTPYTKIDAALGALPIVRKLLSMQEVFDFYVRKEKRTVIQYKMRLSDLAKQRLLAQLLNESEERWYQDVYTPTGTNCTTELFKILDRVSPAVSGAKTRMEFNPASAEKNLAALGLISSGSELPTLNVEMAEN